MAVFDAGTRAPSVASWEVRRLDFEMVGLTSVAPPASHRHSRPRVSRPYRAPLNRAWVRSRGLSRIVVPPVTFFRSENNHIPKR